VFFLGMIGFTRNTEFLFFFFLGGGGAMLFYAFR